VVLHIGDDEVVVAHADSVAAVCYCILSDAVGAFVEEALVLGKVQEVGREVGVDYPEEPLLGQDRLSSS
jgi:hypothetical protein